MSKIAKQQLKEYDQSFIIAEVGLNHNGNYELARKSIAAAAKAGAIAASNQARSGQVANLQIQPASSTPKTAGTQTFKKRRIASNRKQQLTSGINLGTSSLLNI